MNRQAIPRGREKKSNEEPLGLKKKSSKQAILHKGVRVRKPRLQREKGEGLKKGKEI